VVSNLQMRARVASAMALVALVTACGGGGGGTPAPVTPPPPAPPPAPLLTSEYNEPAGEGASTAARYGNVAANAYAEFNNAAVPAASASNGLLTLSGSIPAGNSFAGLLAIVYPPMSTFIPSTGTGRIAAQDYSDQTELRVVAGSAQASRLLVQLIPQGGPFNGCVPSAELSVGSAATEHVLALTAAVWTIPAHCTAAERALTLANTLRHLQVINVGITQDQVPGIADGAVRSFTIGKLEFAGPTQAPIDYAEVVSVYNKPAGLGDSLAAQYGGLGFDVFSEHADASATIDASYALVQATLTVPAGNTYGGLLLNATGPGSTWFPSRANSSTGTGTVVYGNYGTEQRLRVQVGSRSASHALVRLYPHGGPGDSCVPTYVLPVDAMAVSRDISLTDAGWFVPDYCSSTDRARTALAAVADLRSVAVGLTERSELTVTDGVPRDFTLGEIAFVH